MLGGPRSYVWGGGANAPRARWSVELKKGDSACSVGVAVYVVMAVARGAAADAPTGSWCLSRAERGGSVRSVGVAIYTVS